MSQRGSSGEGIVYDDKKQIDTLADRLILDIKAFMLLSFAKEESVAEFIEGRIVSSQDAQVADFARILKETGRKQVKVNALFFTAIGEMILAAIMAILGIAILAPSVGGLNSPSKLFSYFSQIFQSAADSQSSLSPIVPAIELLLSLLLLLAAFYSLRMAAVALKEGRLSGPR